jgi:hypothetical protein
MQYLDALATHAGDPTPSTDGMAQKPLERAAQEWLEAMAAR